MHTYFNTFEEYKEYYDHNPLKVMIEDLEQIHGELESGKLSDKETGRLEAKFQQLSAEVKRAEKAEQRKAQATFGNGSFTSPKVLDDEGKVRMYAPNQKISKGTSQITAGEFLRAAIDKPRTDAERTLIQNSLGSDGISLPSEVAQDIVDKLRKENILLAENGAGSQTITLTGNERKIVTIESDMSATWHQENAAETTDDSPTLGAKTLAPKTLIGYTEISREVLMDSSNVEQALEDSFVGSLNDAMLTQIFSGATANAPTGLASLVTTTTEYPNAGSPSYAEFVKAHRTLYDNNVPQDGRSHIISPDVFETLNLLEGSDGQPKRRPFGLDGVPEFISSTIPTGESYVADFSDLAIGFRTQITIEQHPSFSANKFASLWLAFLRVDWVLLRNDSFVRIEEAEA